MKEDHATALAKMAETSNFELEEKIVLLKDTNSKLWAQQDSLITTKLDLQNQIENLKSQLKSAVASASRADESAQLSQMADQVEKILEEKRKLQEMFDQVNEKNKALRHKSGQLFLMSLQKGATINKTSVRGQNGGSQIFLEDDEAIERMIKEIDLQRKGDLKARLMRVCDDLGIINCKQFKNLIHSQLRLSAND